jgi:2-iminoacetate synthase
MFPYCKIEEEELRKYYSKVTGEAVKTSLSKLRPGFTDLINMLSPAAVEHLEQMRIKAAGIKRMHFGNTIRLYAPLYISSYCINDCVYCGFRTSHHCERKRLSMDEIIEEASIIKGYGIDSLLLVSGEDPNAVSMDFLEEAVRRLKKMFSYISIEIFPLDEANYRRLFNAGVHGMTIYQETYDRELYDKLHRRGPKKDYDRRLQVPVEGAKAGFYNLGLGALLGLYDWRIEIVSLAAHGVWLRKKFWKSKVQFSFPRITPVEGGLEVEYPVGELELEQMMLAFRIFFQEADLYVSTRESHDFRKRIADTCASHVSAGSQVIPGGYSQKNSSELGQFTVNDQSSVGQVKADIESIGLEPVFKDWDNCLGV